MCQNTSVFHSSHSRRIGHTEVLRALLLPRGVDVVDGELGGDAGHAGGREEGLVEEVEDREEVWR